MLLMPCHVMKLTSRAIAACHNVPFSQLKSPLNSMFLQQRYFSYETKEATDFTVKDQDLLTPHLPQQSQLQLHLG